MFRNAADGFADVDEKAPLVSIASVVRFWNQVPCLADYIVGNLQLDGCYGRSVALNDAWTSADGGDTKIDSVEAGQQHLGLVEMAKELRDKHITIADHGKGI